MSRSLVMLRRLRGEERGATIVEFALIVGPMLLLLLGGLELGYNSYVRAVMQGALSDAARAAAVEYPIIDVPGNSVEEQVENLVKTSVGHVAPQAVVSVTSRSYFDFSSIGDPEKLMTDHNGNGQFDEEDGDCWEDANGNETYDGDSGTSGHGGADDVVHYTASVTAPRLFPLYVFLPAVGSQIDFKVETAVRNQPYNTQPTPAVICA